MVRANIFDIKSQGFKVCRICLLQIVTITSEELSEQPYSSMQVECKETHHKWNLNNLILYYLTDY